MKRVLLRVRRADYETDHAHLVRIAKQSKYTSAFGNRIFSGSECYEAGRVRVGCLGSVRAGFTCFRCRVRDGVTVLYFVGVRADLRGRGLGTVLVKDLLERADGVLELKVMKDNPAVRLYERLGLEQVGDAYDGSAWLMRTKTPPAMRPGVFGE